MSYITIILQKLLKYVMNNNEEVGNKNMSYITIKRIFTKKYVILNIKGDVIYE